MNFLNKITNRLRLIKYNYAISTPDLENRFSNIYKHKLWFKNGESQSGSGSTLEATQQLRRELPKVLRRLKCNTLLDLGCGDFNWMKEVNLPCNYIGIDIVKNVIDSNTKKYASSNVQFIHMNPGKDSLPASDVILCREVLFHLSFADCYSILKNVIHSGATYIIITNHVETALNKDIRSGEFRNLRMEKTPFCFPAPILRMKDDHVSESRTLDVWNIEEIELNRSLFGV